MVLDRCASQKGTLKPFTTTTMQTRVILILTGIINNKTIPLSVFILHRENKTLGRVSLGFSLDTKISFHVAY